MSERIVLQAPGSELVMIVKSIKPETVEKNEYFLFDGGTKETLVPQSSVNSQLTRLNLTAVGDMVGKGIKFSRSTKMSRASKPFWNIDLATPEELKSVGIGGGMGTGNGGTPAASVPAGGTSGSVGNAPAGAAPAASEEELLRRRSVYANRMKQAVAYTLEHIQPLYAAKAITLTDDGAYKHAYSIYRSWEDHGLIQ